MALTFRITKAKFEKLSDEIKEEYEPDGDKHYKLDVDGLDDAAELRRAKERAEERATDAEAEVTTLNADITKKAKEIKRLEASQTTEGKDITKVEERWQRKLTTAEEAAALKLKGRDDFIRSQLIDNQAMTLATEISTVPSLMAGKIKERLTVDFEGEKPVLVILDKDNKPVPTMKIADLKTELLANPELKPILVGSKATGGAAQKGNVASKSATPAPDGPVDVNALEGKAFIEHIRTKQKAAEGSAAT